MMTTYVHTTWTILIIAVMTAIAVIAITIAMKEYGRSKQTNITKRKEPKDKKTNRSRSATPKRTRITNHKKSICRK